MTENWKADILGPKESKKLAEKQKMNFFI